MAWIDTLNHLLGIQNEYGERARHSRDSRHRIMENVAQSNSNIGRTLGQGIAAGGAGIAKGISAANERGFQSREAGKERQWSSRESDKARYQTHGYQMEREKYLDQLQQKAEARNYTYNLSYTHPGTGARLPIEGDGTLGKHEANMRMLSSWWTAQDAKLRGQAEGPDTGYLKAVADMWSLAQANPSIGTFFNENGGIAFSDEEMSLPIDERMNSWKKRFNKAIDPMIDGWLKIAMSDNNIPDTPGNRKLLKDQFISQIVEEIVPPEEEKEPADMSGLLPAALLPFTSIPAEGAKAAGKAIYGGVKKADEKIDEYLRQTPSPVYGPADVVPRPEGLQTQEGYTPEGVWEYQVLAALKKAADVPVSPADMRELQQIYDMIAAEGKYGGETRPERKQAIDELLEQIRKIIGKYE